MPVYYLAAVFQYWAVEVEVVWMVLWAGATAAGVVTAGLVEMRYFVVAWVLWRCNVKGGRWGRWMETAWFVGVNAVTTWAFVERGFEWVQEPGVVQRFMW